MSSFLNSYIRGCLGTEQLLNKIKILHFIRMHEAKYRNLIYKFSLVGAGVFLAMFPLADRIIFVALGNQWLEVESIIVARVMPLQDEPSINGYFFKHISLCN